MNLQNNYQWFKIKKKQKKFIKVLKAVSKPYSQMPQSENERHFFDPIENKKVRFPSLLSRATVYLSVIVPSYNEQDRCNNNSLKNLCKNLLQLH